MPAKKKKAATPKKKTVTPTRKPAAAKKPAAAAKGFADRWRQLTDWLDANQPDARKQFNKPAKPAAVAKAEKALGRSLPADYKEFLGIHNGQEEGAPMVEDSSLLPVEEIAARAKRLTRLAADEEEGASYEVDGKVKPIFFSPGWVPIGSSPRGRDFLCIDFDPGKKGTSGQIILVVTDFNERFQVAPSFAELLGVFVKEAKAGEIEF